VRRAAGISALLVVAALAGCASEPTAEELGGGAPVEHSDEAPPEAPRPVQRVPTGRRERVVAEGSGWQVTTTGRPVETFDSAGKPSTNFAPRDVTAPPPRKRIQPADPASPWVAVPDEQEPADPREVAGPPRRGVRVKAVGVDLVPGRCGPAPVARYGLDWSEEEGPQPGAAPAAGDSTAEARARRVLPPTRLPPVPPKPEEPLELGVEEHHGPTESPRSPTWLHAE